MTGRPTVVIKLSGAAFAGQGRNPLDGSIFEEVAGQIAELHRGQYKIGIVPGGGNIFRGSYTWGTRGLAANRRDELGMLATALNAQAIAYQLEEFGVPVAVIARPGIAGSFGRPWDEHEFDDSEGRVVVVAGGTGETGVSSDVAASQLAVEMRADLLIMSKHGVNGLYTEDPRQRRAVSDPEPVLIPRICMEQALRLRLGIMDRAALEICQDKGTLIRVVGAITPRSILSAAQGEEVGSLLIPGCCEGHHGGEFVHGYQACA